MRELIHVGVYNPADCQQSEIADFMALVLAGGEVSARGLDHRVRSAKCLAFLRIGYCLCGVAALKVPEAGHREEVSRQSGVALPEVEFPLELGWVFIMPSVRGRNFSVDLTRAVLTHAGHEGVLATSRTNNTGMHATLTKFQFKPIGKPWPSQRGEHQLQLFVRPGDKHQKSVTNDGHSAQIG